MLLVFLYLILISFFTLGWGALISEKIGLKVNEPIYDFLNGLFFYLIIFLFLSFFTGLQSLPVLILIGILGTTSSVILFYRKPYSLRRIFPNKFNKFFLGLFTVMIIWNSSFYPLLQDNETYYLQTIKWARAFGFVPGLVNLHPFLGQFSGWHILQAGFSGFGNFIFNDLNAVLLLFFSVFILKNLYQYSLNKQPIDGIFGFQILILPFLLVFVNSPSPDLSIIIIAQLIFYLFIKNYADPQEDYVKQMIIWSFLAILIKITAVPLLFFSLILIFRHKEKKIKLLILFVVFFISSIFLILTKNYILTGYPFYPFNCCHYFFSSDWKYPETLKNLMEQLGKRDSHAFSIHKNFFDSFQNWFFPDLLHGILHIWALLVFIITPWIFNKLKNNTPLKIIYIIGLVYLLLLIFLNPNIRFYIYFPLFLSGIIFWFFLKNKYSSIIFFSVLFLMIFINLHLFLKQNIDLKDSFIKNPLSKYENSYQQDKIENLRYYFINSNQIFWETGNAPLPAVSKKLINFFEKTYHIVPQKRKNKIKEGFWMKKIKME